MSADRPDRNHQSASDLADCVVALRELILAGERYRLAAATLLGVSVTDSQAISYLLARGPLGQHEFADAMSMTTGSITAVIDRLEKRGLVERETHPTDRRRSIVTLSATGLDALSEIRDWMAEAFADVPPDALPSVAETLQGLAARLVERARTVPRPTPSADGSTPRRLR